MSTSRNPSALNGVQRATEWTGLHLGRLALTTFAILVATGIASAWWNISHNAISNDCNNNLFYAGHLAACASWRLHDGVANGIEIPFIAVGMVGTVGFTVAWLIRESEKKSTP
jgi:hypothetical protein